MKYLVYNCSTKVFSEKKEIGTAFWMTKDGKFHYKRFFSPDNKEYEAFLEGLDKDPDVIKWDRGMSGDLNSMKHTWTYKR